MIDDEKLVSIIMTEKQAQNLNDILRWYRSVSPMRGFIEEYVYMLSACINNREVLENDK